MNRIMVVGILGVLCVMAACAAQPTRQQTTLERLAGRQRAAASMPGGAREANAYASDVIEAFADGTLTAEGGGREYAMDAAGFLEQAAQASAVEAPALLGLKGVLLIIAGDATWGLETLEASMDLRPTLTAGTALAVYHGARGELDAVADACRRTLEHLEVPEDRHELMGTCIEEMHASTVAGGLSWASNEERAEYASYQQQIAAREESAAADRQRAAEVERQRELDVDDCIGRCKERGYTCLATCDEGSQTCQDACQGGYEACLDRCEVDARR